MSDQVSLAQPNPIRWVILDAAKRVWLRETKITCVICEIKLQLTMCQIKLVICQTKFVTCQTNFLVFSKISSQRVRCWLPFISTLSSHKSKSSTEFSYPIALVETSNHVVRCITHCQKHWSVVIKLEDLQIGNWPKLMRNYMSFHFSVCFYTSLGLVIVDRSSIWDKCVIIALIVIHALKKVLHIY